MRKVTKRMAALVTATAVAGCGVFKDGDDCEDGEPAQPLAMTLTSDEEMPEPMPLPAPVPTLSTYPSCAALKDELARLGSYEHDDWDYGDGYDRGGRMPQRPSSPRRGGGGDVKKGCAKGTMAAKSAKESYDESAPVATAGSPGNGGGDGGGTGGKSGGAKAESDDDTFTNTQEKDVDEPDVVKIGAHNIYIERNGELLVVQRDGLKLLGKLSLAGLVRPTLFVDGDTLVVLASRPGGKTGFETTAQIYQGAAAELPKLVKEHVFSGQAYDSRYVGSRLVLVFRDKLPRESEIQLDHVSGIPCQHVVRPAVQDHDARFVKVATLNAKAPDEAPQYAAVVGGGDQIYMTTSTLYVTKRSRSDWTIVTRVDFDAATGAIKPVAVGAVEGRIKDQWAFREIEHQGQRLLSLATSSGELWSKGAHVAQNHLFVLKAEEAKLAVAAAVNDFGTGEDIRSVRYVGTMAYVVTFKKTDPLFAFDLSDPLAPKKLGELKIPGFSTYMHPVADGRLLGVGFDALDQGSFALYQGIQVSLFDVSNPLDLKRLDVKIHGERGSSSDVTGDHHAFFFDPARRLAGIPVVELTKAGELAFSGAVLYEVQDAALVEKARVTHMDLIPAPCREGIAAHHWWQDKTRSRDVNRLYLVDGKLLTISQYGLKAHDPDQPQAATSLSFGDTCVAKR